MGSTDEDEVLRILRERVACQYGELEARAFKQSNKEITWERVKKACFNLEEQGVVDYRKETIESKNPKEVTFVWVKDVSEKEREVTIDRKSDLLRFHFDNPKLIGDHATRLVEMVCRSLHYKRIKPLFHIGHDEIDLYAKHPKNKFWQAISVKNLRDPIGTKKGMPKQIVDVLDFVALARRKWKRVTQPAIVASYCFKNWMEMGNKRYGVNIAIMGAQVAPLKFREVYEALNNELAFNFEITDEPTKFMTENIEKYICNQDYPKVPTCRVCGKPMTPIYDEKQRWYCIVKKTIHCVWLGKEQRWLSEAESQLKKEQ
jgi:hypothetical protein